MVQVIALMLGGLLKILSTHEFLGSCLHMSTNLLRVYYERKLDFENNNLCADPEHSVWGVLMFCCCFLINNIFQRDVRTSLEKHLDPLGPIASLGGPFQYF